MQQIHHYCYRLHGERLHHQHQNHERQSGRFAHIDLTDGTKIIRIMVDTFHEWSGISLDGLEIIVGRANSEVVPNSGNDCHALWNNELDIISRGRLYEIVIDRRHRKFYGTHEHAVGPADEIPTVHL